MAEHRRFADLDYGQVGQLTYIPRNDSQEDDGVLHTRRLTSEYPRFRVVGSPAELYPPTKSTLPEASSEIWQERRVQKRWLFNSHPEAFMGDFVVDNLLKDDLDRFKAGGEGTSGGALLASGPITDVSDPSRTLSTAALATAAGESGEVLRLSRLVQSQWQWGKYSDASLKLAVIDPDDGEDEVIWASDSLPIIQIKFATSSSGPNGPIRWLLVQKQTSTTILQPEYHKVPVSQKQLSYDGTQPVSSRIDPNPLLTLSHHETSGNLHADVAFNPATRRQHPQIVIVDECGYWKVWEILGRPHVGDKSLRASPHKCGHITGGCLREIPASTTYPSQKHGVSFVGTSGSDDLWSASLSDAEDSTLDAVWSQHILVWNSQGFEQFDLGSNVFVSGRSLLDKVKAAREEILDIQLSPINVDHFFVLTTRFIFWMNAFPRQKASNSNTKQSILLTCPHAIHHSGRPQMAVSRAGKNDPGSALMLVYSAETEQLSIDWFSMNTKTNIPTWHRQVACLPGSNATGAVSGICSLRSQPAELIHSGSSIDSPGARYVREGVQFFQMNILGKDLSVWYCICSTFDNPFLPISLPTTRTDWSKTEKKKGKKKRRKQLLAHWGTAFVVPDELMETGQASALNYAARAGVLGHLGQTQTTAASRAVTFKVDRLCNLLRQSMKPSELFRRIHIPDTLFEAIRVAIKHGMSNGQLSLLTWQETMSAIEEPEQNLLPAGDGFEVAIQSLFVKQEHDGVIATKLRRNLPHEPREPQNTLQFLNHYLAALWLGPISGSVSEQAMEQRRTWAMELAKDIFMSSYGIIVQDIALLDSNDKDSGSSQKAQASGSGSKEAQAPSSSFPAPLPDAVFRRLQLLAPSLVPGSLGTAKPSSVLSFWPTERGVSTQHYVSSVAISTEQKFDEARERLQKREARRKAQAEKFNLRMGLAKQLASSGSQRHDAGTMQSFAGPSRATEAAQTMSSQQMPSSSQSAVPITMSQPVLGVYGDRRKAKKAKKKSGFR